MPEVETVVRQIRPDLLGRRVADIVLHNPKLIRCRAMPPEALIGLTVRDVRRRGKFIRLDLAPGPKAAPTVTVLIHLRMTGRLTVLCGTPPRDRHDHIDLTFKERCLLRFRDMRQFGGWWLLPAGTADSVPPLSELGPEPLEISRVEFRGLLAGRRQRIKALLLDQRRLAGMGNIYCDEALFAARIHPATLAARIPAAKADALWRHMRRILRRSISQQGTTVENFLRPDGRPGGFQYELKIYGRGGEACTRCRAKLQRLIVAGRGTTVCPRCQKL